MKRLLLALAFILVVAGGAYAQESEISGGGGGSSSVGPGTAGAIPKFASTTTLGDSKLVTSGTNGGTLTLYDDTAVTGASTYLVRPGAAQTDSIGWYPLFNVLGNVTGTPITTYPTIGTLNGTNRVQVAATDFVDGGSNITWILDQDTFRQGKDRTISWVGTTQHYGAAADIGLARASAGVVKVTDGSSGYGGLTAASLGLNGQVNLTTGSNSVIVQGAAGGNTTIELREAGGGSANFKLADSSGNANIYLATTGSTQDFGIYNGAATLRLKLKGDNSGLLIGANDDVGIAYSSAGVLKVTDGSSGYGALDIAKVQGWQTKTLTESAATGFVDIALAQNTVIGGYVEYVVRTTNGTDYSVESGQLFFTGASKTNGTVDDADVGLVGTPIQSTTTANSWTNTFSVTKGTNKITLNCQSDSTLTSTDTITLFYRVHLNGAQTETITGL